MGNCPGNVNTNKKRWPRRGIKVKILKGGTVFFLFSSFFWGGGNLDEVQRSKISLNLKGWVELGERGGLLIQLKS